MLQENEYKQDENKQSQLYPSKTPVPQQLVGYQLHRKRHPAKPLILLKLELVCKDPGGVVLDTGHSVRRW
jgi:hypothetical protein